jgi:hypothetical protein
MADPNPNPARITAPLWWLWLQLQLLAIGSTLGGIYANKSGYHNTRAANLLSWPGNYSIRLALDLLGPSDKSAALDWTFPEAQRGDYRRIALFCARLLAASQARDPRLRGLREWYGQADADAAVEGWDLADHEPASSDSSHLWHLHLSFWRAYVGSMAAMAGVLSVLAGETLAAYLARGGQLITEEGAIVAIQTDSDLILRAINGGALHVRLSDGSTHVVCTTHWQIDNGTKLDKLLAGQAASAAREIASGRAIEALASAITAGGGNVETAPIIAAIEAAAADTQAAVTELQEQLAAATKRAEAAEQRENALLAKAYTDAATTES